ncbi:ABC transporter substrate binding protein [compost metagenome]
MAITNQTFFDTLADAGYVRDKNLDVVFKTAEGDMTKMPSLVRQVLDQKVEILVVSSSPGCAAAKAATTTIPVLCISVQDDPVKAGLTADISYGTDNLVGVHSYLPTGIVEQLRLLKTIKPDLNILAII